MPAYVVGPCPVDCKNPIQIKDLQLIRVNSDNTTAQELFDLGQRNKEHFKHLHSFMEMTVDKFDGFLGFVSMYGYIGNLNSGFLPSIQVYKLVDGDQTIGLFIVSNATDQGVTKVPYVSYMIDKKYAGKGYTKETVTYLLKELYNSIELTQVSAYISEDNYNSVNMAKSMGFVNTGSKIDFPSEPKPVDIYMLEVKTLVDKHLVVS